MLEKTCEFSDWQTWLVIGGIILFVAVIDLLEAWADYLRKRRPR